MSPRILLVTVLCIFCAVLAASCRRSSEPEILVLKYTGMKADMEEGFNARLAAVTDADGKPVYRFSHTDEKTGVKSGSKFRRVNGAEVEFRPVPFPQYQGADDIFMLALSTQTQHSTPAVHLFFVDLYWFQTFSASWLMPFEGPEWDPANFKHDFIEACQLTGPDGRKRVYAIPFSAKGNMLFYRKDVLELFGLTPPETWDALRYTVQTVRQAVASPDYPGNLKEVLIKQYPELNANPARLEQEIEKWKARLGRLRYGLLFHSQGFHNDFYPIAWGYGGDVFTPDEEKQRRAVQALYDIKRMIYDSSAYPIRLAPPPPVFESHPADPSFDPAWDFAEGNALFMINWDNRLDKMARYKKREIQIELVGICPIPHMPDCESASNIGSWGWVVNGQTVSSGGDALAKKAVEQFLNDLTSEEAQEWLAEHFGSVPSREVRLPERVIANLQRTNPTVVTLFQFFRTRGKVRFMNRPGSKRLNDLLEGALHRAIADPPKKDPAAEMDYLKKILDEVRLQAKFL